MSEVDIGGGVSGGSRVIDSDSPAVRIWKSIGQFRMLSFFAGVEYQCRLY
jgi:hypothetical protein